MKALAKDPQQRFATVKAFAEALESGLTSGAGPSRRVPSRPRGTTSIEQNPVPKSSSPGNVSLEQIYDSGLTAKHKGDLEQAYSDWTTILKRDPDYMNGLLAQRIKELELDLVPFRVKKLSQQATTLNTRQGWLGDWQTMNDAVQELLKANPQHAQLQSLFEYVQGMLKLQQDNAKYQPLYKMAQRYVEEAQQATDTTIQSDKIAKAKAELDYLQKQITTFGDPAKLADIISNIEWKLAEPQRVYEAERKEREERRRTDRAFGLLSICIALLPGGIGATIGLLYPVIPFIILIALVIVIPLLIALFYIVRKPHNLTSFALIRNFLLAILFTFAFAIGMGLFLSNLDHSAFARGIFNGYNYVGRQINFGLILGASVTAGTFIAEYFILPDISYSLYESLIRFDNTSIKSESILFLSFIGAIGNAVLCSLVGVAGSYSGWGYGFGYGWNYALFAMLVGIVVVTGVIFSIYFFLFLSQKFVRR